MTSPRPPLRLVDSPNRDAGDDVGFDPIDRAPHDLHAPYRELAVVDNEAEPEDPRAELVRRLLEYEQMKLAAAQLDALPVIGRDFLRAQVTMEQSNVTVFPDVSLGDLREAWADILKRAKLNQHHHNSREQLSVREYMTKMLRRLQGVRYVEFQELFETATSPTVLVVTFIAMLELSRERLLEVTQAEAFAPIYVRLAYTPN